ncbi:TIR domain-containing protein [Denitrobaculum tricleocarpae]|uniref:CD-NTase-associated protein 12/Pycsar effector protein TIR domain-containing protein n=1 Tax=Denitrobaculum tricleocarpae TaxID=2591009 RepID=A0A545TY90_9PROT|nr:nucleotide-binding protein [Denitrobaculum tricleocarpae]TQV82161.1 hypothetical protein FKG95_08030 [Denitrobaculum tricleocarpae]
MSTPKQARLSVQETREALPKLERRINDLKAFDVNLIEELYDPTVDALKRKVNSTLQEIFGHGTVEYNDYYVSSFEALPLLLGGRDYSVTKIRNAYKESIAGALAKLTTLKELFEERLLDANHLSSDVSQKAEPTAVGSKRVFVVHGHDDGAKETVARYLSDLKLTPIILHEQPNKGQTIVEKFTSNSDVEYAIILFTPDDMGYPAGKPDDARPRARQNVLLELGYFTATLGRQRVCILSKGDVEVPSDYAGVLYVKMDDAGAWRFIVASEMKSVGLEIDLNYVRR